MVNTSFTITGQYTGTPPTALDYAYDAIAPGSWTAATAFTASGGAWSATVTAPSSAGNHFLVVRDHTTNTNQAASPFFAVSVAPTLTLNTPPAVNVGTPTSFTGTYTGTAPAGVNINVSGGSYIYSLTSFTASGGAWSGQFTFPNVAVYTIGAQEVNNTSVTAAAVSVTVNNYITLNAISSAPAGSVITVGGTIGSAVGSNTIDLSTDGGAFVTNVSGATITGNTWSAPYTVPSTTGSHTLQARIDFTPVTSSTVTFTVTAATTSIALTQPSGLIVETNSFALSGSYTGTAPTGVNCAFDGGTTYAALSGFTASGGTWGGNAVAPAFGSHTVTVQEANNTAIAATSSAFIVSAAPNNAAIVRSPYNWSVSNASISTINAGAYFSFLTNATSIVLNFNVANNLTPLSEIYWRVDGAQGPWTEASVASTITLTIPSSTSGNSDVPYHLVEMVVKSTTETQNRWNAPSNTAVVFTGVTLSAGAALVAPQTAPYRVLVYGDSITEGVRTVGQSQTTDTDRNDAMLGWAFRLGALLGAEVGVVGFGATGVSVAGSGNVPALPSSYNFIMAGVSRSFTPAPNLIVINIGTNDGSTNIVFAMIGLLNNLITACPGVPIAVLEPFNTNQATNLQAAVAGCSAPGLVQYVPTAGFLNATYGIDSLNLHPSGPNNLALVAPQVAAAVKPMLGSSAPKFRGTFQRGLLG